MKTRTYDPLKELEEKVNYAFSDADAPDPDGVYDGIMDNFFDPDRFIKFMQNMGLTYKVSNDFFEVCLLALRNERLNFNRRG